MLVNVNVNARLNKKDSIPRVKIFLFFKAVVQTWSTFHAHKYVIPHRQDKKKPIYNQVCFVLEISQSLYLVETEISSLVQLI